VRLRQRHGDTAERTAAVAELAGVYARFTEGFDFPDLQDARVLMGGTEA
jgi:hypothetical protein